MTRNWGGGIPWALAGRNQISKGNSDTVMWGGEEYGGETKTRRTRTEHKPKAHEVRQQWMLTPDALSRDVCKDGMHYEQTGSFILIALTIA